MGQKNIFSIKRTLFFMVAALGVAQGVSAEVSQQEKAKAFIEVFRFTCLNNAMDLNQLKSKLSALPKFPKETAAKFLKGAEGDVWPVPDKAGEFVLVIPSSNAFCGVMARKADKIASHSYFANLLASPPPGFMVSAVKGLPSPPGRRSSAFTWSGYPSGPSYKFDLSTSDNPDDGVEGLVTSSRVK